MSFELPQTISDTVIWLLDEKGHRDTDAIEDRTYLEVPAKALDVRARCR